MIYANRRAAAWCMIALLSLAPACSIAAAEAPVAKTAEGAAPEDHQPKFIWGLVLNIAFKLAMSAFTEWLTNKLSTDLASSPVLQRILLNSVEAVIVPLASASPWGAKSAGAPENAVVGTPTVPLRVDDGRENYQAVHVAIVGFDAAGNVTGLKPVSAGFRTGERFRLKVLPTFDGILVIENINPAGQRKQIFPPDPGTVVAVKRGLEILVPMTQDYYFAFTGPAGDEQLVVTIRDPRAFGAAASTAVANRKDDQYGSSFVQETPAGTYPVISQALRLKHSGAS
jgi:hypothetical protein